MASLAMTPRVPGHWPLDTRSAEEIENEMQFQMPASPIDVENQRIHRIIPYPLSAEETLLVPRSLSLRAEEQIRPKTPYPTSPSIPDELFYECVSLIQAQPQVNDEERASTSYLIFEPVVEQESSIETTDWRRYEPPSELLQSQDGTSQALQMLVVPSIERIQTRHREEEERRAAASRQDRPLGRVGRASIRPRRQVSMTGALDTTHLTPPGKLSASSATSLSSNDSGYYTASPGSESSRSPKSALRRSFGFSTLFKRKERSTVDPDDLDENNLPILRSREVSPHPQFSRTSPPPPTREAPVPQSLTRECVSCLDDFPTSELIKLTCHSYCAGCFQRLINTSLESETHWPAKCCLNPIPSAYIIPHLDAKMKKKYRQREEEWSIPAGDRIYCAQPTCSTWISPKNIDGTTHSAKCPKCAQKACTTCRGPHHGDMDCPQDPAIQATINLAEIEGWKRCYSCHALVEHNKGCRHMTCRCRAQFCYICGLKWRTCACSDALLTTIQQRAETLRANRNARDAHAAAEAEEERAAIQAVEEFMRAEEERIMREVEEERQREEAQRQREEEEQRRREQARIAAINQQFRGLSTELDSLHDIQQVLMAERYEFETEVLQKEHRDALDTLSIRHPSERQYIANKSGSKIADSELKFETEYAARLGEERRIEDQYLDELRVFWRGKPDGEYKIRESRDELRRDQDKEYRFWNSYRKQQLQSVAEGERRKMDKLRVKHDAEIKAVDGRAKIDLLEWRRKKWAENKWVEEVIRERVSMLSEMEVREYALEA